MVQIGFRTDKGQRRETNEDSLFVMPEQNIYIVADGVGGHNSGEVASMMAVKHIAEYIKLNPINDRNNYDYIRTYFYNCLRHVNELIYKAAKNSAEHAGMATTAVILCLSDQKAFFVNIGDSRAYLIRNHSIEQITEDHTFVNALLKEGSITKEEADNHPQKNMITRALGGEEKILPDFYEMDILKQDIILLCTDGLYGEISQKDIALMASEACSMSRLSADLVDMANKNGGNDNITIICIKI